MERDIEDCHIDLLAPDTAPRLTARDIPQKPLARMAVKIYLLGCLAWDYADTVCNVAATLRLKETRALSRSVRELKRDYDRFRNRMMDSESLAKESELALMYEDICEEHFQKLNYGIEADKYSAGLKEDYMLLVKAVQMAMTVLDVMKAYARECDEWIRSLGVHVHSILDDHFRSLAVLLPGFAGNAYNANAEARKITANILLNEIKSIQVRDKDENK